MTLREVVGRSSDRLLLVFLVALMMSGMSQADTVLITGANRGIGLEFAKQYAAKGWSVIATHRRDQPPETLATLAGKYERVMVEKMDVTDHGQIDALAAKLADTPIDLLINNAGIVPDFRRGQTQSFGTLDHDQFAIFLRTNALGPLKITEAFRDHVVASEGKKVVAITSLAGSFGLDPQAAPPGAYWYKVSKTALNMFMMNVARDLKSEGVVVALLSPGQVRVEKIADVQIPGLILIEPEVSIGGMIKVIESLDMEDSGRLLRYDGEVQTF